MFDKKYNEIAAFLQSKQPFRGPLILAYSGGFDSKALLYLLLELKKQQQLDFELVLAHVDHGWREESSQEAEILKEEAKQLKLKFFLKKLSKYSKTDLSKAAILPKNQEAVCRRLRLEFFQQLYFELKASYLLFAHQKDDLQETVLKRFLEGADLTFLSAMQKESFLLDMYILRPLLSFSKKELLEFLKVQKLRAINDRTNFDFKYQRSRLRHLLLPKLKEIVGKRVVDNLVYASQRSYELKAYLDRRVKKVFKTRKKSVFGVFLEFETSGFWDLDFFEKQYLIKKLFTDAGFNLTRSVLSRILDFLNKTKPCHSRFFLALKDGDLIIEQNMIFLWNRLNLNFEQKILLQTGRRRMGFWELEVSEIKKNRKLKLSSWKEFLFSGSCELILPKDLYYLSFDLKPDLKAKNKNLLTHNLDNPVTGVDNSAASQTVVFDPSIKLWGKRLNHHLAEEKVPFFLRKNFPLIFRKGKLFCDLLSGKKRFSEKPFKNISEFYQIKLIINHSNL